MNDCQQFHPLKITGVTLNWEVENIWNLSFDGVSSNSFVLSDHLFHLIVRRYELSIAIYLCRDDPVPSGLPLLCRLAMVDRIGQEKLIGEKEILVEKGKEFVHVESIHIKDLEMQKEEFLANDTLVIKCNLSASYRRNVLKSAGGTEEEEEEDIPCLETLSEDFGNLYNSQRNSDASLKVGEIEFPVHRTVLSARAPLLHSMLGSQDPPRKMAEIADIDSSIFSNVLFYIYTGKVRGLNPSTVGLMLAAANRFALHELRGGCLRYLESHLTGDNVLNTAALAYECGDLFLKDKVEQYIVENLSTILESDNWRDFCAQRHESANKILTTVLLRMKK